MADSLPARIRAKIHVPEDVDDCWPWIGCISPAGYGRVYWEGRVHESHRVVQTLLVGPIPDGMVIDHMCHDPNVCAKRDRECLHRRCQNPAHHAIVTRAANALRSSSPPALNALSDRCDKGHLYVPGSFTESEGHRRCLICRREADKRRRPRGTPRKGRVYKTETHRGPNGDTPERRERDAQILCLREQGLSFGAIAAELGISAGFAHARFGKLANGN